MEASEIVAGDSVAWTKALPAYPASAGWTLKYALKKQGTPAIIITSEPDGDNHKVIISQATTAGWAAGEYRWQSYVEKDAFRHTLSTGAIKVAPALRLQEDAYDPRSHTKKVLDAIEAAIEGRASRTELTYTIAGRSIQHMRPEELVKFHSHYKRLFEQEQRAEKIKQGMQAGGNKILVRFSR